MVVACSASVRSAALLTGCGHTADGSPDRAMIQPWFVVTIARRETDMLETDTKPHVVVIGGGFAGMKVVRRLARADAVVTLVDRQNHHLFQPLLYEVATAALSPGQIAMPLRHIFRGQQNAHVVLGDAERVDLDRKEVLVDGAGLPFDYLVLATGSTHHYFGNDEWETWAPGLKTIDEAVTIRRRFLLAFEEARKCDDEAHRRRWMTAVIVGGGPTGVELAGTMSEVARTVLRGEFRDLDPASFEVQLIEGSDRLLSALPPELSLRAQQDLEKLGVRVRLGALVTGIDAEGVTLQTGDRISAVTKIWAAGVRGAPVATGLADFVRPDGRVTVEPDLSLPGHPEVFAIGDLAFVAHEGREVPGLAPAALQMGDHVGRTLARELAGSATAVERRPFRYRDKGTLATIGRGKAVAQLGSLKFGGVVAWLLWVFIHVLFLVGFRNRLMVLIEWAYAYVTLNRGARLITGERFTPREPRRGMPDGRKAGGV